MSGIFLKTSWKDFQKTFAEYGDPIRAKAEIDRLKEENAALKVYGAKCRKVIKDEAVNGLYQTHRATDAELDLFDAENDILWHKESLFDLACLYERLWETARTNEWLKDLSDVLQVEKLRVQLAKANEALDWYGDEDTYRFKVTTGGMVQAFYPIMEDRGQRAREARK